ncbi:LacI family DNA-binding transcriptional regulator [Enemella evansiae]|uniref:LacI family transcriptional regulator n=1 Tax=Enemella evansiae TaxID=2016499 RepID=A0A255GUB6_9ACTN|nr:LacI family DNA-binding transcriptional regulator [Enemella evansiae]OYO01986.1 LacI family transcriptional regulator [Enemella evansiae]OYO02166.1 LacI family transcriptional regulator [Enemella evansiae]OYO16744.1 LacI family transcriptional regulator [Enemella evansiae]OYO19581.1 LacI family transcriptional regulator [Enemella evansiae]
MSNTGGAVVTSQDVARYVGVSQPTVSRALRDDPKVSEATKTRIRDAARLLGYVPSATGRALAVGRSHRIGLLLTDVENAFYPHLIAPLYRELRATGYEMVLLPESEEADPVAERIIANGLDGVVLTTSTTDSALPIRLRDRRLPFVYFNRTVPGVAADSVVVDATAGYAAAARRLAELGHRRVGAVLGPQNTSTGLHREAVLRAALSSAGLVLDEAACRRGPFDVASGHAGMSEILDLPERPSAVVCGNDVVAVGVLNAARERGVRVPEEISVLGFDDLPMAGWPLLDLATVAFDLPGMARAAVRLIAERAEGRAEDTFTQQVFESSFLERGSIGPADRG